MYIVVKLCLSSSYAKYFSCFRENRYRQLVKKNLVSQNSPFSQTQTYICITRYRVRIIFPIIGHRCLLRNSWNKSTLQSRYIDRCQCQVTICSAGSENKTNTNVDIAASVLPPFFVWLSSSPTTITCLSKYFHRMKWTNHISVWGEQSKIKTPVLFY